MFTEMLFSFMLVFMLRRLWKDYYFYIKEVSFIGKYSIRLINYSLYIAL